MGLEILSNIASAVGGSGRSGNIVNSVLGLNGGGILSGGTSPTPAGMIGGVTDAVTGFMPLPTEYAGDKGHITAGMDAAYDKISDIAMNVPGAGTIVGAAMKANKLLGRGVKMIGGGTSGMTTADAVFGSSFMQMTPMGLINGFGGSKSDTMKVDTETLAKTGSSYEDTQSNIIDAEHYSGKKYGLFSLNAKREANVTMHNAGRQLNKLGMIADIQDKNKDVLANQVDFMSDTYANLINGGYDQSAMRAAKLGMKIFSKDLRARTLLILAKKKVGGTIEYTPFVFDLSDLFENNKSEVLEFKNGGQMNVIPEGALHARLHHMEDINPELDGLITTKGIPVVIEKDGGEVEQLAEIECNEIMFIKNVTELLEKAYKEYYKEDTSKERLEELAINIGKLLTKEIMENTDDRTGLIKEIQ